MNTNDDNVINKALVSEIIVTISTIDHMAARGKAVFPTSCIFPEL